MKKNQNTRKNNKTQWRRRRDRKTNKQKRENWDIPFYPVQHHYKYITTTQIWSWIELYYCNGAKRYSVNKCIKRWAPRNEKSYYNYVEYKWYKHPNKTATTTIRILIRAATTTAANVLKHRVSCTVSRTRTARKGEMSR